MKHDNRILGLALDALYLERQKIDSEIASLEKKLGRNGGTTQQHKKGRRISAAGRRAISDAVKKRWAAHRAKRKQVRDR
jgi:hypothetical protein